MAIRTEDSIFFVFDNDKVVEESDFIEDGILYFSPSTVEKSEQFALVGQLIGVSRFLKATFGCPASVYCLQDRKIVFKHVSHYTLGLSGKLLCSDGHLTNLLNHLYNQFRFYQGGFDTLKNVCSATGKDFCAELGHSWNCFVAVVKRYGNEVSSGFQNLPILSLYKETELEVYVQSSQLLEEIRRTAKGTKGGCLLYNSQVVCSDFTSDLTSKFLIIRPRQQHLPCQPLSTDLQLQGVRIFKVYLTPEEFRSLDNDSGLTDCSSGAREATEEHRSCVASSQGANLDDSKIKIPVDIDCVKDGVSHKSDATSGSAGDAMSLNGGRTTNGDGLVEVEMFVHGSSDSACVLLMETGSLSQVSVLKLVWQQILLHVSEIERLIRGGPATDVDQEKKDVADLRYMSFNNVTGNLSGNLLQPVTSSEHQFCEAAQLMHEEFRGSPDTRDISLRTHQSVFSGFQDGFDEFFCWQSGNSLKPGLPIVQSDQNTDQLVMKFKQLKSDKL